MALKGFDPGNGKWYDNMKEHITKQAPKDLESETKKRVEDMQSNKQTSSKQNQSK